MLFEATTAISCSIQPLKSESIVCEPDALILRGYFPAVEVKSEFKWLGFRLKIEEAQLTFCKKGVEDSIRKALKMCWHIFQVSSGIHIRWKTYKTYVVPFIELFLPFQIQEGLDKQTEITRAQHSCLSNIVGLTTRNSSKRLREVLAEFSVKDKSIRLAKRFCEATKAIGIAMQNKLSDIRNNNVGARIRTRSGNAVGAATHLEKVIRSSFLFKLREAADAVPDGRPHSKTQFLAAKRYAVAWKARIKRKIAKRSKSKPGIRKRGPEEKNPGLRSGALGKNATTI